MPSEFEIERNRQKKAIDELVALNQIASAINSLMSVNEISRVIIDHCLIRTQSSQGAIFLLDDEEKNSDKLVTFSRGFSSDEERIAFHLNLELMGWMIKNKGIFLSNDTDSDKYLGHLGLSRTGIRSILSAPLMTHKGLLGLLVLFNKKTGDFSEDDMRFLGIAGAQVAKVIENARLREKETKLDLLEEELKVAHRIQEGFLPKEGLILSDCQIRGINIPAKDVGGDFYDYIKIDDNRLFFSIGDVSGKGVPAALLMANIQAVFRSQVIRNHEVDLLTLAEGLNNMIFQCTRLGQLETAQYVTAIFGYFDCARRVLKYINGGHPLPIIIGKNGNLSETCPPDLIIGVVPQYQFTVCELLLEAGDSAVFYSDGVTEAVGADEIMFGEERLMEILTERHNDSISDLCDSILQKVNLHCQKQTQSDDITLLVMKLN